MRRLISSLIGASSVMLASNVIFQKISEDLSQEIVKFIRGEEKEAYKSILAGLAESRRVRTVFVQKRPVEKQISWLVQSLKLKTGELVADQVLQIWLLKAKTDMLTSFLDKLGIEHDGEGSVEGDLPNELDGDKLKEGVEGLIEKYGEEEVRIYLALFQAQKTGGWPELHSLIDSDERLSFK